MRPCEIVKLVEYIKKQTGHTGDIFININDNAIPIEWIERKLEWLKESDWTGYVVIKTLLQEWEKENGLL